MFPVRLLFFAGGLGLAATGFAQALPEKAAPIGPDAGELIEGLPALSEPHPEEAPLPAPASVAEARRRLEAARRKQVRWEALARRGVLSRVEAERCTLEVAEALFRFEEARGVEAQAQCDAAKRSPAAATDTGIVAAATAALEAATFLADEARTALRQTRIALARTNLDRHRRLYAGRLVSRAQLERAQATLVKAEAEAPGR